MKNLKKKLNETGINVEKIEKAFHIAEKAHRGQQRKGGDPFFTHPYAVANILLDLLRKKKVPDKTLFNENLFCAALLHDTVEDTSITIDEIKNEFGERVAFLVEGLTIDNEERKEDDHYIKKLHHHGKQDKRIYILKIADKLHNMRTLNHLPKKRQKRFSRRAREHIIPLARELQFNEIADELEKLCDKYSE